MKMQTIHKKNIKKICLTLLVVYVISIYLTSFISPHLFAQADDGITDIGGGDGSDDEQDNEPDSGIDVFDAQAFIASNYERKTGYRMHLYAFPDQEADLYRDFAIYIFVDSPATYLIKIDDQKVDEGEVEWRHIFKTHSEYNYMDVTIIVQEKETGAQREFTFKEIDLLDSPWQGGGGGGEDEEPEKEPEIAKPYFSLSRGEFTIFIFLRVVADIVSGFFAVLIAMKFAAIKADMAGTARMF
jgi:hypothetical protein